jgi:hypothetical protein
MFSFTKPARIKINFNVTFSKVRYFIIPIISEYNLPLVWTNSRTVPTATAVIQMMLTWEMTWPYYRVVLCCVYLVLLLLQCGDVETNHGPAITCGKVFIEKNPKLMIP